MTHLHNRQMFRDAPLKKIQFLYYDRLIIPEFYLYLHGQKAINKT